MNRPHELGVHAASKEIIESVGPQFIKEGLLQARAKTIDALEKIRSLFKEGMTELEARKIALGVFSDLGVKKHWHQPYIRFGKGTTLTFNQPLQSEYVLQADDPYYLDLGPVWKDKELGLEYEGDYGDSFEFGNHPEGRKCAQTAREIFTEAKSKWQAQRLTGEEIYRFMKNRATEEGYLLLEEVEGHRLSDFPHQKYSRMHLGELTFTPSESLWVLELQLNDRSGRFGAFYEDLI